MPPIVGRVDRKAGIYLEMALGCTLEKEVQGNPRHRAGRKKFWKKDHYGLEKKVKERILEYLAVAPAREESPRVDSVLRRTSGRRQKLLWRCPSVAPNRPAKFVRRVSLGRAVAAMRLEIRGHRRTYIGGPARPRSFR